jgi:hypothetical protein
LTIVPVLLPLTVESTGFDGFIAPCVFEMMVGGEKKWPFYQPEQGPDIGKFVHLPVLVNRQVKMCLKGDENIAMTGVNNAPQYSSKDGRNG